jgi:hypothetical protein
MGRNDRTHKRKNNNPKRGIFLIPSPDLKENPVGFLSSLAKYFVFCIYR